MYEFCAKMYLRLSLNEEREYKYTRLRAWRSRNREVGAGYKRERPRTGSD